MPASRGQRPDPPNPPETETESAPETETAKGLTIAPTRSTIALDHCPDPLLTRPAYPDPTKGLTP
jgi:hypothetical protein